VPEKARRTVRTRSRAAKPPAPKQTEKMRGRGHAKPAERKPIVRTPKAAHERPKPKERRGVVVSNAMDKTIVVRIETARPHPIYKKVLRRSKKIHAHDPENRANVGDVVRVVATRPLSKTKSWRLAEIVEAAK